MLICSVHIQAVGDPKKLSWYDWSKQKAQQYMPYVPGAVTGLSGASLLGLQYAEPYLGEDATSILTKAAAVPVNAYWMAKNIWKNPLEPREAYFGYILDKYNWPSGVSYPTYLQQYAPYLLGTSAALLAAPYLYRKYQDYQRHNNLPGE